MLGILNVNTTLTSFQDCKLTVIVNKCIFYNMSGFDQAGLPGSDYIREAFSSSNPYEVIENFQQENGILLPSLQPTLQFLDLHNVSRFEFHQNVMNSLRVKLLEQIKKVDKDKLRELLSQSFPFIHVPHLRPVILEVMKLLITAEEVLPQEFLEQIAKQPQLYKESAMEVKRQIWVKHQPLFGEAVGPILNQYILNRKASLFTTEPLNCHNFFSTPPKVRRKDKLVQDLAVLVGKSLDLYNLVLQFLRTLFMRTRDIHYCTLRAELLMAIHDLEIANIKDVDPCHKFTWCLDTCVRERIIEAKRAKELKSFLLKAIHEEEQVLGDIAMVLCDPFAIHTLASSIIKIMVHLVQTEAIPRSNSDLEFLLRLLNLGVGAWNMIDGQVFRESELDPDIVSKFIPLLMGFMVDDIIRGLNCRLHEPEVETDSPSDLFVEYITKTPTGLIVTCYYVLHVVKNRDKVALSRILPLFGVACQEQTLEDPFFHYLVTSLALWQEEFSKHDVCELIFDQFLLTLIAGSSAMQHTLRLLWFVYPKMDPNKVVSILTATHPSSDHSDTIHELHATIVDRIAGQNVLTPSQSSSVEQMSSASPASSSSPSSTAASPGECMLSTPS